MARFTEHPDDTINGFNLVQKLLGALCLSFVFIQLISILIGYEAILELGHEPDTRLRFNVLRLDNNSYHLWLVDPIVYTISLFFSPVGFEKLIIWPLQLTICALGIFNLLRIKAKTVIAESGGPGCGLLGITHQLGSALLIAGTVGIIAPFDVVSLGSICWLPMLLSLFYGLKIETQTDIQAAGGVSVVSRVKLILLLLLIAIAALMHLVSASFMAPLTALFFWGTLDGFRLSGPRSSEELPVANLEASLRRLGSLAGLIFIGIWIALIWGGASAELPDYPADAVIVPDDGVAGITRPLSSSDYRLMVSHPFILRKTWGLTTLILTFLSAVWLLEPFLRRIYHKRSGAFQLLSEVYSATGRSYKGMKLVVLLGILCLFDLYLPAQIREISPLASLSRVYPGAFLIPLVPILMSLNILVILINLLSNTFKFPSTHFFCCITLLATLSAMKGPKVKSCGAFDAKTYHLSEDSDIVQRQVERTNVCRSPSRWLVENYGEQIVAGYRDGPIIHSGPLPIKEAVAFNSSTSQISASPSSAPSPSNLAHILTDHHNNTRWGSASHGQHGDEWLRLTLSEATSLDGILLATGDFKSDFPAGLKVDCITADSAVIEAFKVDDWQGPIHFTSLGYPYFGAASDVRIIFPNPQRCSSLIIYQIGQRATLDWSIAEVRRLTRNSVP